MSETPKLVIVGSIGIDTIETPTTKREEILGGSASYACAAASFFTRVGMVGVVGTDFPAPYRELYQRHHIDLEGLQVEEGKTFRWSGVYEENMNNRSTLSTDLNVFADFSPNLPASYQDSPYVFLGNISPDLQMHVLDQMKDPKFIAIDTMDLWINNAKEDLLKVIGRVDMLTLNDSEARLLTGEYGLIQAARKMLAMGPKFVLIKKGEHGCVLFSGDHMHILPAFLLEDVVDPTGAGDSFAGALMGKLASSGETSADRIQEALVYANVVASFGVEGFSLDRLDPLTLTEIEQRAASYRDMIRV